jgi:hypothetical protein
MKKRNFNMDNNEERKLGFWEKWYGVFSAVAIFSVIGAVIMLAIRRFTGLEL